MTDGPWGSATAADQAIAAVAAAVADAVCAIDAIADPDEAWGRYENLRDYIRSDATGSVGSLRDRLADRIRTKHQLSLAQLGARIGVGKSRAGQMVDSAKTQAGRI